ncbi:acetylornithine deacetylase [Ferruginivarius sediminum]|uniref:Acetylornithine deacetylase n=1 Tax=Ferruginivarius sediminum TaxID=2661937 RepID=A0A369TFS2_9PROT|nr:acetylornithine deacetylase [Ferruginivarius sediminum]RDD61746.1 acetylornithine deacetylase [Ferruginivarius sediminum]
MTAPTYSPREMIAKLVSFDTVSDKSNLPLIDFVEDYLKVHGLNPTRVYNEDRTKSNLYATVGPNREGGVVLSGHTDVVPTAHQTWSHDPFDMVEKDGRLYGRGTCDMKGFVAMCLAMVPEFANADLRVPIHLALSYDEEVGCTGCVGMVEAMANGAIAKPRAVLVGEPTDMKLVVAHKGVNSFHTTVTGREAHSSQPHRGANANIAAGKLVAYIARMAEEAAARAPADSPFEPPQTSFQVGLLHGGNAANIIPGHCEIGWEFRTIPSDDANALQAQFEAYAANEVLPALRATAPEADIVTEKLCGVIPLAPEQGDAAQAEALVRELTGQNQSGVVSYGTEGGVFQAHGFSTVVVGPGSIDQAHQPDEYLEVEQLDACIAFLRKLRDWASQPTA